MQTDNDSGFENDNDNDNTTMLVVIVYNYFILQPEMDTEHHFVLYKNVFVSPKESEFHRSECSP